SLFAAHSVENCRERQKPPALVRVLGGCRKPAQFHRRVVRSDPHRCRHGANPPRAMESAKSEVGNPVSQPERPLVLYMRLLRQVVFRSRPSAWPASMVLFDVRPMPASTVRGDAGTDPSGGAMYKTQVLP